MENNNPDLGEIRVRCVASELIRDLEIIAEEKGYATLSNYLKPALRELRNREFKELNLQNKPNIP